MTSSVLGCARQEAAPGRAGTGTPKADRVVLAVAPPQRESNEMRHMTGPNSWQLRPMYESLIGVDPSTGKLAPQLATEWKVEPNGSSIRFKLRQGIPFHDNWGSFSAQDVPVPWKENVKEDSLTGTRPYWTRTLREIEIVNPQEVVFHLNRPDGHFFESVSEARGNMEAQSLAHLEKQGPATMQSKPLAGTGPYQYKEREQGAYLRFQRVPYTHWRSTPDFPEFEFRWIKEASTRLAALVTGEVHIADLPQDLQPHAAQRGYKLLAGRVPALRTFVEYRCCNFRDINDFSKGYAQPDNPLMDIRVRRALSKAVDRNELNKAFFAGKGELMLVNHFHPTREGWNPEWERRFQETYGHDPGRARALLAEAGHGPNNPLIMNIRVYAVSGYSGSEDLAEAIGGAWRAIGVNVNLLTMDENEWTNLTRQFKLTNYAAVTATNATQFTGATVYSTSLGPRGGAERAEVDTLLKQVLGTLDEHKQRESWRAAGDAKFDAVLDLPLFWLPVEAMADPTNVSDWTYPGSLSGSWSHVDLLRAAR